MSRMYNTTTKLGREMATQNWTLADFAAATGVNARTISDYLAGRKVILIEHLWSFADVLGVEDGEIG